MCLFQDIGTYFLVFWNISLHALQVNATEEYEYHPKVMQFYSTVFVSKRTISHRGEIPTCCEAREKWAGGNRATWSSSVPMTWPVPTAPLRPDHDLGPVGPGAVLDMLPAPELPADSTDGRSPPPTAALGRHEDGNTRAVRGRAARECSRGGVERRVPGFPLSVEACTLAVGRLVGGSYAVNRSAEK